MSGAQLGPVKAHGRLSCPRPRPWPAQKLRSGGAIAVLFAGALFLICALFALALDLPLMYNRKVELQKAVDAAALAAARQLNGTTAGVTAAATAAKTAAERVSYAYNASTVSWSDEAIKFGISSTGPWVDVGSAKGNANGIQFVKVDTSELAPVHGQVQTLFIQVLAATESSVTVSARAIAGPSTIGVTPLAVCAMSPVAAASRTNPGSATPTPAPSNVELVEYGFRRGVSYDLMQLNPSGTAFQNFLIDPVAPPGTTGSADDMLSSNVSPFVCSGTMAMTRVIGGNITVSQPFPLATFVDHLNSRFDQYPAGGCDPYSAPPDANVKAYDRTVAASVAWMSPVPSVQGAQSTTTGGKLWTIADPLPAPATNTNSTYGVLWSYARAVPYSSYVPGSPEPTGGYTTFATSAWSTLYDPGRPATTAFYPATTPYAQTSGAFFLAPPTVAHRPGVRQRRVLNVPLLACPVSGSSASVLAIAKFFMTKPATSTNLFAEFGGLASEQALVTQVELYP